MISPLHRLDIWYRTRRRRQEFVWRLSQADVVVVAHTKSGRTWLLVMISHLFHLKYGTPATEIIKFDNLHRLDPRVPKLYYTRYADLAEPDVAVRRSSFGRNNRFVFLFRDPRDVAVSYYFHLQKRSTPVERARKSIPDAVLAKSLFDFVVDDQFGLPHIVQLMNRWIEHYAALDRAIMVRYEDLRAAPAAELGRVMEFIGTPCRPDELDQAIEFASLENLRQKETGRFFGTDRLRPTDSSDPDSFKVRRGKVGGNRDSIGGHRLDGGGETSAGPGLWCGVNRSCIVWLSDSGDGQNATLAPALQRRHHQAKSLNLSASCHARRPHPRAFGYPTS